MRRRIVFVFCALLLVVSTSQAGVRDSLKQGTPKIQSMSALAFGPEGVLFVGDTRGAAVFAIDTDDREEGKANGSLKIANFNERVASALGTKANQLLIRDLAVNPISKQAYVTVQRGRTATSPSVLLRINAKGKITEVSLKSVKFAKATLPNVPKAGTRGRTSVITDLAFADGKVYVAGLSNEEFASTLREIPFPFKKVTPGTGIKIFHGAHGQFETRSPIRTLVPYEIGGNAHMLAAYTCTPLVKVPLKELEAGKKVTGTTVAELGNRNRPLDMITYTKDKQDYVLIANSSRGTMKVSTKGIEKAEGITKRVPRGGKEGLTYETIKDLENVVQLAKVDNSYGIVITSDPKPNFRGVVPGDKAPKMTLEVIQLP